MAVLTFLLAAFLLVLPFRYVGNSEIFSSVQLGLAFIGVILIVPGMVLGAALGARTYRVERSLGVRIGAAVGAVAGLASYLSLSLVQDLPLLAVPPVFSEGLLLYALFATGQSFGRRRRAVLVAAGLAVLSGAIALVLDFDLLGLLGILFSTAAAAVGGSVGGTGYARAGGNEMIPPGSTIRPRERRRKPG